MGKSAKSPPEILSSIEAASKRVGKLATELTRRIESFEEWLNTLPGRVPAEIWVLDPDDSDPRGEFGLRLARSGKTWILHFCCVSLACPEERSDWKPLKDASVEIKLFAIDLFPQLLESIATAQEEMAQKLEAAHAQFDSFAEAIGAKAKEGA